MRYIFNPSIKPITIDVDKFGDNPEKHTLEAGGIEEFEDYVADILVDALADRMLWANPPSDKNREKRLKELKETIEVKIDEH